MEILACCTSLLRAPSFLCLLSTLLCCSHVVIDVAGYERDCCVRRAVRVGRGALSLSCWNFLSSGPAMNFGFLGSVDESRAQSWWVGGGGWLVGWLKEVTWFANLASWTGSIEGGQGDGADGW